MEINSAFRVFWKSREWNVRKSTFNSDQEIPLSLRRRYFKRKKKGRPSRDSEEYDKQQVGDHMITFPCSICKHEIDVREIFLHKKQHVAWATLGFQWMGEKKPGPSVIAIQRQLIIAKLLSSSRFTEKILQSINNAFELLWKKQIPAYYKIVDSIHRSSTHPQTICHLLIKGVAICEDRNSTWRADMNDKFTVVNNFGNKHNVCFFGLFDGHHGVSAAELTSVELPVLLLHQLSRFDPSYQMTPEEQNIIESFHTVFREEYIAIEELFSSITKKTKTLKCEYENIHKAFAKAFWRMDRLLRLGRKEVSRVRWSGCSAVTCILEGNIKNPYAEKRIHKHVSAAESFPSQMMPQIISGVLHIANTATHGLWEVLDTKEVTALAMTMFQVYKETYCFVKQNKSLPSKEPLLFPINEPSNTKSESSIHILFQYKPESTKCVSTTNSEENVSDSKCSNSKNAQTFPPEKTNHDLCSEKETKGPTSVNDVPKDSSEKEKESCTKNFYEGAAKYISHELVNAALVAGSRDNITVMVILLNGSEYQFLT
ncbi:protein phosphatase 2C-like domain-containing protein 1 isoform X2 [Acinonyx jubatus]|uniref:Protein phosphatase 2C-like domain-containing protein 1 isoform X2 n=1 Tax=Acinonyx jubatus TaxID=32536 RepID=A0ABM3Q0L8_ACIJB|nr:protein phosphatase 2C-like domain-containing protein 1 isoform X2 [Acinonyx jubatus]